MTGFFFANGVCNGRAAAVPTDVKIRERTREITQDMGGWVGWPGGGGRIGRWVEYIRRTSSVNAPISRSPGPMPIFVRFFFLFRGLFRL